jgi:hypothetical protein
MTAMTETADAPALPMTSIRIVDVSTIHDHIPPATPSPGAASRTSRVVAATRANVVRLIPGLTRLPIGPGTSLRPSAA